MKSKRSFTGGAFLVLLGIGLLVGQVWPRTWPLILIAVGVGFVLAAVLHRVGGLAVPGAIIGGVGGLLFWQSVTRTWESWLYAWPLVPGLVGLGLLLGNALGMGGRRTRRVGLSWLLLGAAVYALMLVLTVALPDRWLWPLILVGLGGMFLLSALLTGVAAQAIPGAIIGAVGGLLFWQNLTGTWESWSYAWPLVPGSVGLGLVLANLLGMGGRAVRRVGGHLIAWSLVTAVIFATFFAFDGRYVRFWPAMLVLAGAGLLAYGLRGRQPRMAV